MPEARTRLDVQWPKSKEAGRLAFASFTVGFFGSQVRAGKATIRTTDGREIELQPYMKQMLDATNVKSVGTTQTTIIHYVWSFSTQTHTSGNLT